VSGPVRARDLAITSPSLTPDASAEKAARLLAKEAVEGVFVQDELGGRAVRDLRPAEAAGLAEVDGDDTMLSVAATFARTGASPVVVRDEAGRLLGGITTCRLVRQSLGAR
jgi:CBS domain-containing protein